MSLNLFYYDDVGRVEDVGQVGMFKNKVRL